MSESLSTASVTVAHATQLHIANGQIRLVQNLILFQCEPQEWRWNFVVIGLWNKQQKHKYL